jgi:hypothetical protein
LRRQLLDAPSPLAVPDAVRQVAGLQAQIPKDPYIGLWSRLAGFTRDDLAAAISGRQLVRVALMRSTIHLVTAADCRGFRPAVQPALDRELFTTATWSRPIAGLEPGDPRVAVEALVARYLAAFGPAGVRDIQAWAGVARLGEVVGSLRPRLRAYRGTDGRELWDLADAELADEDAPVPVRFLPEYDNAILGYADRSRILPDGVTFSSYAARLRPKSVVRGGVLVDGFLRGTDTFRNNTSFRRVARTWAFSVVCRIRMVCVATGSASRQHSTGLTDSGSGGPRPRNVNQLGPVTLGAHARPAHRPAVGEHKETRAGHRSEFRPATCREVILFLNVSHLGGLAAGEREVRPAGGPVRGGSWPGDEVAGRGAELTAFISA